jgi:hypothetical protein
LPKPESLVNEKRRELLYDSIQSNPAISSHIRDEAAAVEKGKGTP